MTFRDCAICGRTKIIFDMESTAGGTGWKCRSTDQNCAAAPYEELPAIVPEPKDPLQDDFGFDRPEDGSERRFVFTAVKQGEKAPGIEQPITAPWVKFRFWWFVHNAIAHPLIAIAPRRTFFQFHDYTSRKMHGV